MTKIIKLFKFSDFGHITSDFGCFAAFLRLFYYLKAVNSWGFGRSDCNKSLDSAVPIIAMSLSATCCNLVVWFAPCCRLAFTFPKQFPNCEGISSSN